MHYVDTFINFYGNLPIIGSAVGGILEGVFGILLSS